MCFVLDGLSAQTNSSAITTDTAYYQTKKRGNLKPVPSRKADVRIITSSQNGSAVERRISDMDTGSLTQHKFYKDGRPSGKWQYYDETGKVVRERNFDKLVYGYCADEEPVSDTLLFTQFGKGYSDLMNYLGENIKYPIESLSSGVNGRVRIKFVVNESGKAIVLNICGDGLDGYCDLVVWEIIENMPLWSPPTEDEKPVRVSFYLPVSFKLK